MRRGRQVDVISRCNSFPYVLWLAVWYPVSKVYIRCLHVCTSAEDHKGGNERGVDKGGRFRVSGFLRASCCCPVAVARDLIRAG
jgi:hypothetical protein